MNFDCVYKSKHNFIFHSRIKEQKPRLLCTKNPNIVNSMKATEKEMTTLLHLY